MKDKTTNVTFTEQQLDLLQRIAEQRGLTVSELATQALGELAEDATGR